MSIGSNVHAWRTSRRRPLQALASDAGVDAAQLSAIEAGEVDPTVSTLQALASALRIPPSWLYGHPKHLDLLTTDGDGEVVTQPDEQSVDPVMDHVLQGARHNLDLYVLLTTIIASGDPRLLRAAEANLTSLAKQARQASIPWGSRPPGHFEPPDD
jgi:transcriptional regulator with XRE-family HTH domain